MKLTRLETEVLMWLGGDVARYWCLMVPSAVRTINRLVKKEAAQWSVEPFTHRKIATITPAGRAYLATLYKEDKP